MFQELIDSDFTMQKFNSKAVYQRKLIDVIFFFDDFKKKR